MLYRAMLIFSILSEFCFAAIAPVDLQPAVPIVVFIVAIFLILLNLASTTLSQPRLKSWVKIEFRELVAGIIIIVAVTSALIGSNTLSSILTGSNDYVGVSQGIIDEWLSNYDTANQYIIITATKIRSGSTYSPHVNVPIYWVSVSYSSNPLGGMNILLIGLNIAAHALSNVTFIYEGLRVLVLYFKIVIPKILLPLAFIMRVIPFTRSTGNTLIALAVSSIVFLPLSIILADALNDRMGDDFPNPVIANTGVFDADPWGMVAGEIMCGSEVTRGLLSLGEQLFSMIVCLPFIVFGYQACVDMTKNIIYPIMMMAVQLGMGGGLAAWTGKFMGEIYLSDGGYVGHAFDALYLFLGEVNDLVLIGYLDFILIAIITISSARSISTMLGGQWYMAGIQRLI